MKRGLLLLMVLVMMVLSACNQEDSAFDPDNTETEPPVSEKEPSGSEETSDGDDDTDAEDDPDEKEDETLNETIDASFLDIYHTNDVHGAIEAGDGSLGLAHMANLMTVAKEDHYDNTLILDGGDALQGSALSNHYEGESYIELMNAMEYDAMVVGNHEFDWGLTTVTDYFAEDGLADFPLLGANIVDESTGEIPKNIDPYTVVEKAGRTIGIIGTIGYGLEGAIAPSVVEGYSFFDPAPIVEEHARTLRNEEGADLVFLLTHDSGRINNEALALEGDARVDAVFNAHSHGTNAEVINGTPVLISGGYGSNVGSVHFSWENDDRDMDVVIHDDASTPELMDAHPEVQTLIEGYTAETDALFKAPIIDNDDTYSQSQLSEWIADLMRHATDADIGFQNYGGTRTHLSGGPVTLGDLYEIWPFENRVKTVALDGATVDEVKNRLTDASPYTSFESGQLYTIATNDYIFDQEDEPFMDGENPHDSGLYLRDLAEEELTLQSEVYDEFDLDNPFLFTQD